MTKKKSQFSHSKFPHNLRSKIIIVSHKREFPAIFILNRNLGIVSWFRVLQRVLERSRDRNRMPQYTGPWPVGTCRTKTTYLCKKVDILNWDYNLRNTS